MPHFHYDDWHGNWRPLMDATERHRLAMIDAETCSMDELEAASAIFDGMRIAVNTEESARHGVRHKFEPSGFTTSCADGCCREETCALCGQHDDANLDHEDGQVWVDVRARPEYGGERGRHAWQRDPDGVTRCASCRLVRCCDATACSGIPGQEV